jgi:hypothetical protein
MARRRTFVIGFTTAARSFIQLAKSLFASYPSVKYLLGYKISQDHIEMLFSRIRARGGFNNNPDVNQFRIALRNLLVHTEITASSHANCLSLCDNSNNVEVRTTANINYTEEDPDIQPPNVDIHRITIPDSVTDIVEYIGK